MVPFGQNVCIYFLIQLFHAFLNLMTFFFLRFRFKFKSFQEIQNMFGIQ